MGSFLARLFPSRPAVPPPTVPSPWEPVAATLGELLEASQKATRGQARLTLRLEEVERKVEAGFEDLRRQVANAQPQATADLEWADLLDALDALAEARSVAVVGGQEDLAAGITTIASRLERFLAQASIQRVADPGAQVDGNLFRVVGTLHRPDLPDGVVVRVVRAAALAGGRLLREGEVITNHLSD